MSEPQDIPLDYDRMSLDDAEAALIQNFVDDHHLCLHVWETVQLCAICGGTWGLPQPDYGNVTS